MKKYKIKQPLPQFGENVTKDIEVPYELVKEIRADAINDLMNKLCDHCIQQTNECNKLECPFGADSDCCNIVIISEQLKEQNK